MAVQIGCRSKSKNTVSPEIRKPKTEMPSQEGWKSSIILSRAGKPQAVIQYGHMAEYENRRAVLFDQGVQVDFYDVNGKHSSRLNSERGEYDKDNEDVVGEGNVVVVSDTGITLQTEQLRWDHRTEKIFTRDWVRITTANDDTLYGLGFESTTNLSHWVIQQPRGHSKRGLDFNKMESSMMRKDTASFSADTLHNHRSGEK